MDNNNDTDTVIQPLMSHEGMQLTVVPDYPRNWVVVTTNNGPYGEPFWFD